MIVLDAGVVIALFSPDDAHHDRAKALFARQAGPFLLHSLTVAQTLVAAARVEREGELWDALRSLGAEASGQRWRRWGPMSPCCWRDCVPRTQ
ncbi:hypothetical protein [Microbacterium sp. SL75]|uniref:hypothetical protein n=1 Tax=Microbacterium sp. SL75 TaxID=2995140 RepID=UPI00226EA3AA|nr:hypothetical protein [Microbacterium sp. SL75]WAC69829.1 hypothetical protein OVA17_03835 [Microbacterium sp. SL75]